MFYYKVEHVFLCLQNGEFLLYLKSTKNIKQVYYETSAKS